MTLQFFCETSMPFCLFYFHETSAGSTQNILSSQLQYIFKHQGHHNVPLLLSSGIIPTFDFIESVSSTFTILICLFLHYSLLRASSIISRYLIVTDSLLFHDTRTTQVFFYFSTLGRLAQGQHPEWPKVWWLFYQFLCSPSFSPGQKFSVVI